MSPSPKNMSFRVQYFRRALNKYFGIISGISSDILSGVLSGISSNWRLRSGEKHCCPELVVEVRRRSLPSGAGG